MSAFIINFEDNDWRLMLRNLSYEKIKTLYETFSMMDQESLVQNLDYKQLEKLFNDSGNSLMVIFFSSAYQLSKLYRGNKKLIYDLVYKSNTPDLQLKLLQIIGKDGKLLWKILEPLKGEANRLDYIRKNKISIIQVAAASSYCLDQKIEEGYMLAAKMLQPPSHSSNNSDLAEKKSIATMEDLDSIATEGDLEERESITTMEDLESVATE